ncbi:MAG: RNB domain-containing ribonuclease, partial [Verrucomicrobiota bacterium]|nr:RNB domain-containing ribonuclease [Verrucomicrobiota bacterium]
ATVRNHSKLNYYRVGEWLEGKSTTPLQNSYPEETEEQLRLQKEAATRLNKFRKEHGTLTFGSVETVPLVAGQEAKGTGLLQPNPARDIIESFMVTDNVAMARFLRAKGCLAIRLVVREPKRWDRICAIAAVSGERLPELPDSRALADFLTTRKERDPLHFPELSLAILKCLGPGEYVVEHPGAEHEGHFGLAVNDYTHSTAPNRRYADLVTQRILKAAIANQPPPFTEEELTALAAHCTERDSAARRIERLMKKIIAANALRSRIGETFVGVITGVSPKGTFIRLLDVAAEGRIIKGETGLDLGEKVKVRLREVDVGRGFIDFERAE